MGGLPRRTPLAVATVTPIGVRAVEPARPLPPRPRKRGWTLLLAPPATAAARTRTFHLGRLGPGRFFAMLAGLVTMLAVAAGIGGLRLEQRLSAARFQEMNAALADAEARAAALADTLRALRMAAAAAAAPTVAESPSTGSRSGTRRRSTASAAPVPRRAEPLRLAEGVVLPVQGRISSRFDRRRLHPILRVARPHNGVDVSAPSGTPIVAPAPGRVTFAGRKVGFGLVVEIEHADGVTTRYAHCKQLLARVGQEVVAGETIATVGETGLATAPHLHYEVRVNGRIVDPLRHVFPAVQPAAAPAPTPTQPASPQPVADTAPESSLVVGVR